MLQTSSLLLLLLSLASSLAFRRPGSLYQCTRRVASAPASPAALRSTQSPSAPAVDVNAYPDSRRRIGEIKTKVTSNMAKDVIDINRLRQAVKDMEAESSQPQFWDNQDKAQELLSELNKVKGTVDRVDAWKTNSEDIEMLLDLSLEDPEEADGYIKEAVSMLYKLEKDLDAFEIERLLGGKFDKQSCTLCIQSGAGGTEANDWAGMLYR